MKTTYRCEVTNNRTGEIGVRFVDAVNHWAAAAMVTALQEAPRFIRSNIFADQTTGDVIVVTAA